MKKAITNELKRIAEKNGWTLKEAKAELDDWWKTSFKDAWEEVDGKLDDADLDYQEWLLDAWDTRTSRASFRGSAKGTEFVGMIIADKGRKDVREEMRQLAATSAMQNLQGVLSAGIRPYKNKEQVVPVCRAYHKDGKWQVANAQDQVIHQEEGAEGDIPNWAIEVPGQRFYIAMIDKWGKTMDAFSWERSWTFVGNEPDKLLAEGPLEPLLFKCQWDAGQSILRMNVPIRFNAEIIEFQGSDGEMVKMLKTNNIAPDYSLDWVDNKYREKVEQLFSPQLFLTRFVPYLPDLTDMFDYHEENAWESSWGKLVGPTFAFKATVEYIDYVGRELDWIEGGIQYSMRVSSQSLRREDANAAIYVNISKHLDDFHNAFNVRRDGDWLPYTTGTQVIVVGKSRTYEKDNGDINLSVDAYNVYAIPSRAFLGETPSDDSNDLDSLGGFRSD